MKKIFLSRIFWILLSGLFPLFIAAQNPTYTLDLRNDAQVSSTVYEFDIYLLRTGAIPFEYASGQYGVLVNSLIKNSGSITASIVAGSSDPILSASNQNPTSIGFNNTSNVIMIGARTPPGAGNGAIISNVSPGTRICRVRLTNTVAFGQFQPNLTWTTTTIYPTQMFAYVGGTNTSILNYSSHTVIYLNNPVLNPPLSVTPTATPGTVCAGDNVQLNAGVSGGSGTYSYTWTSVPVGFNSTLANPIANPTVSTTYNVQVNDGISTVNASTPLVTVNPLPTVTAASVTPSSVCGSGQVVFSGTASSGSIKWYTASIGGTEILVLNPTISLTTTYYAEAVSAAGCLSAVRTPVTATVNPLPTVSAASVTPTSVCGSGQVVFSGTASSGTIRWYTASSGGTEITVLNPTISSTTTYYAEAVSPAGCLSAARTPVTATVNPLPTVTAASVTPSSVCGSGQVVFSGTASSGTIKWYTASTGGTEVTVLNPTISSTTTYFAEAVSAAGCLSAVRTPVTATVNPLPTVTAASVTPSSVCGSGQVVFSGTASSGTIKWYTASVGGTEILVLNPTISSTTTYYAEAVSAAGCLSAARTPVTATVNPLPTVTAASVTPTSVCGSGQVVFSGTASSGTIKWYTASTGGTEVTVLNPTISSTTTYYAEAVSAAGCLSAARTPVTATVNPLPTVTAASVTPSSVCGSGQVVFSGTASSGTIRWYTASSGGTEITVLNPTISSTTTYYAEAVSAAGCLSAARTPVTATVNPLPTVTAASVTPTSVCGSGQVVFSGTASSGTIKWYTASTGGTEVTVLNPTISSTTTYYAEAVSAAGCLSAARTPVTATVIPTPSAPTGSTTQTFCSVTSPTIANLVASGTLIQWYAASSGGSALLSTTPLVNGIHYYASQTVSGCESTSRLDVTAVVNTTPGAPTGSATQTFCSVTSPTIANLVASGTLIQWYAASTGGSALLSTTPLVNGTQYYASQTVNGCESTTRLNVTAVVNTTPGAPTGSATQTFCSATSPTIANLVASGTLIQWYAASTGGTALLSTTPLVNGTHYYASQTVSGCESTTRLNVTVVINTTPAVPTGSATQTFCSGSSPTVANLVASGTLIQWYAASSGGSALLSTTPLANGSHYYASQTVSGCESTSRLDVTAVVNTTPGVPTGSATQTFCSVTSPTIADLVASGTLIQWYAASSGGSALLSTTALVNGTHYYASQTVNGCESTTRLNVTAVVNTTPGVPTGSATQTFCSGSNPTVANLVASGTLIQWYAALSGGSALISTTPLANGTHYYASQTVNGCESTSRLDVTAVVNTTPAVPTGSATQTFCSGSSPTVANLTASGTLIQWYAASSGGSALLSTTPLVNGIHYYASQTVNGCESTTRLNVTAVVNTTPAAPTGTATQTFCSATTPTIEDLVASGTLIQWYSATSGGSALLSTTPLVNGTHYYASQTVNGCESTTRLNVTAVVNTTPAAPTGTATQYFCSGASPTVANLTASGTLIQWYAGSSGGSALLSTTPLVNGTHYYASQTVSGCESTSRLDVTAVVNTTPGAPTGSMTQTYCSGTSPLIANLSAIGTSIKWYNAAIGGSQYQGTDPLVNNTHYFASQTVNGCESTLRLDVTAVVNTTPSAPTGSATQTFCSATSPTIANLVASGTLIQWYAASSGGSALLSTAPLVNGSHYYASQTVNGCESATRLNVTAVVNTTPSAPTGTATQTFCSATTPTIADLVASGTLIQWYAASTGGSALLSTTALVNGTHYYASQTVSGCESTSRLEVTAVVNTTPGAPTGSATQTFCSGSSPTVANLTASGTLIQWYAASSGGSALLSTAPLVNGTHYYASQTVNGCESTSRLNVTAVVNTTPAAPSGSATQTFCSGTTPAVADLVASGTSIQWYLASGGGSALSPATPLINNTHYFASQTVNGCESITRLDVTVVVNTTPGTPTGSATQTFCSGISPTVANLSASGTSIKWYDAASGGNLLATSTALVDGAHYFASQTSNGCESMVRLDVTAVVTQTPIVTNQTTAILTGTTFTVIPVGAGIPVGTNYTWTAPTYVGGVTGGSAQTVPQAIISGTLSIPSGAGSATYIVTPSYGGCTGANFTLTVFVTSTCVSVTIDNQPVNNNMCVISGNASFTVGATGTSPTYQWQYRNGVTWENVTNGTPAGASYTGSTTATLNVTGITQVASFLYQCFITNCGGGVTVTSNTVTLTVNALPATPTIGSVIQPTCSSATGTITISAPSPGPGIFYSIDGSTYTNTTGVFTNVPAGIYTVTVRNSNGCISPGTGVTISTQPATPPAPTGDATQTFCSGTSPTIANLVASGTSIQWYSSSTGGTPLPSGTVLANNTHYYASQTVGVCESTSRLNVTAVVNTTPGAPTGSATQTFCSGTFPTIASLTASGTLIQWYSSASGGTPLLSTTALVNGTHYYASQTVSGCESTLRLNVTAVVNTTPAAPSGSATQTFCSGTSPTIANLVVSGTSIQWYSSSTGGTPLPSGTVLGNNVHYYASQTVSGCESTLRLDVTAIVNTSPAVPTGSVTQTFCSVTLPTIINLTAAGTSIQWYSTGSGGTPLSTATPLVNGTHYFASQTVNGCESTSRLDVTVVVNTTPGAPTGSATQTFCSGTFPTIANLSASGTSIQWYSASSGGSALLSTTALVNNAHYYASQTVSGCESTSRLNVTAVVNTTPVAPTGSPTQSFCSGVSPVIADLTATGTSLKWYNAASGGTQYQGTDPLINNSHYYATQTTVAGCESTSRLDVTAIVNITPAAPSGNATQTFCSATSPTVASLTATGTLIQWYSTASGGSVLSPITVLANNTHYFASQTVGGCESTSRLDVTAVVNTTPIAPTGNASQTFCSGISPTIANLVASGTSLQWYSASSGGSALSSATALVNNTHYFASQTVNGCESISRLDVTVTITQTPNVTNQTTSIQTGTTFTVTPGGAGVPAGTTYTWTAPTYTSGVTGGSAQTTPQPNITGTLSIPSGAGTANYTVTPSYGGCSGASFTVTVIVSSTCIPVTIDSQPADKSFCVSSGNASFTIGITGTAPFTYQWQYNNGGTWSNVTNGTPSGASYTGSTSGTLNVTSITQVGSFQYRCNISNCSGGITVTSNSATLTVNALPDTPTLGPVTQPTCSTATGTITVSAPTGAGFTYSIDGSTYTNSTGVFNNVPAGIYTVTVRNSNGCISPGTGVTINAQPATPAKPTVALIQPTCNIATGTITVTAPVGSGLTYSIDGANYTNTSGIFSTVASGSYTVTARSSAGCVSTGTAATINTQPITPTVIVTNPSPVCSPSTVNITSAAITSGSTSGLTFTYWTNSGATIAFSTPTAAGTGTYYIKGTTSAGCFDIKPVVVTVTQVPAANAGSGGNECDLTFQFNATPSVGAGSWSQTTGPGTSTFSPGSNSPTATVTVSAYGTYTFTWTEVNGTCSASNTVTINFYQQPVAVAGPGGNNCGLEFHLNGSLNVGNGVWTKVSGPGNVTFVPAGSPATTVTVTAYGIYTLRFTGTNGTCSNSSTTNVTFIELPAANAGSGGAECDLDFALHAIDGFTQGIWSISSGPGNAIFSNSSQPESTVTVDQFGIYEFAWTTNVSGLCSSTDMITVNFHDLPDVSAGRDTIICIDGSAQLQAAGEGTFLWTPADSLSSTDISNPVAVPIITTIYTVTLTDQYGCKNSDDVKVEVWNIPVADAGPDRVLEYLFIADLEAAPIQDNETGAWSVIEGSGQFSAATEAVTKVSSLAPGENIVLWRVSNGVCPQADDYVTLLVNDLLVPSLITPNGDVYNQYFKLQGIETLGTTDLTIFDRRGAQVYKNKNYDNTWYGQDYNGNDLPDDTYFYVIKSQNGKSLSGYIVIRR